MVDVVMVVGEKMPMMDCSFCCCHALLVIVLLRGYCRNGDVDELVAPLHPLLRLLLPRTAKS